MPWPSDQPGAAGTHAAFGAAGRDARQRDPEGVHCSSHVVAGRVLRLRVAGSELGRVTARAFLPAGACGPAELTVDLWDASATGTARPRDPVEDAYAALGGPGERIDVFDSGRFVRCGGPDFAIWCDRASGHASGWVRSLEQLPSWTIQRPFQALLASWLPTFGVRLVHAAAVARAGRALLLPGPNGVGKSTTSIASLHAGLDFLGDDAIALEAPEAGPLGAHCLHAVGKFATARFAGCEELSRCAFEVDGDASESWVYLREVFGESVIPSASVAAIAFPRLSPAPVSRWAPLSAGRALERLLKCLLEPETGRVREDFAFLADAVHRVPCFGLEVGCDPGRVPEAVGTLLDSVGA